MQQKAEFILFGGGAKSRFDIGMDPNTEEVTLDSVVRMVITGRY